MKFPYVNYYYSDFQKEGCQLTVYQIPSVVEESSLLPTLVDGDIPSSIMGADQAAVDTSETDTLTDFLLLALNADDGCVDNEDDEGEEVEKNGRSVEEKGDDGGEEEGDDDGCEEDEYDDGGEEEEDSNGGEEEENATRSRKRRRSSSSSNNSRLSSHRYSAERQTLSRDESEVDADEEEEENATASDVSLGDESIEVVAVSNSTSKRGIRATRKRQRQQFIEVVFIC